MALPPGPVGLKFWQPRIEVTEAGTWYTLVNVTLTTGFSGAGNRTYREVAATSTYDAAVPATGIKLRVTIQAGGTGATWTKAYVGHAAPSGDAYDFDGTQVQLLFSGSTGATIGVNALLTSDPISYAFDKTKPLVVSIFYSGGASVRQLTAGATDFTTAFASGDDAATTDVSAGSYTVTTSAVDAVTQIEVFAASAVSSGNITLPADGGSYTLTGSDIGLGLGYWLTGFDVAFTTASAGSTTLAAAAGSYTLTGTAAALAYSATLTASAGSYAITGEAVGLGPGYQLTGFDAAFVTAAGGGTTLTASAGSYTLTGSAAALALRHTAGAGSYSLTGFDAGLNVISGVVLFCGSGSYTLTGTDAAFVLPAPPTTDNYTGGGVRRIRKFGPRKRKREELEELLDAIAVTPPEIPALPPAPEVPPAPGLMADVPTPPRTVLRSPPDEDEDEIALLLELLS